MHRPFVFILCVLSLLAFAPAPSRAQQSACPTSILVDIARAGSTCFGLEPGQACVGNGSVTGLGFDGGALMTQVGDRADVSAIQTLSVESSDDELGIVSISLPGDMFNAPLTMIGIGDVRIENIVPPLPQLDSFAISSINIRNMPNTDAAIIARAGVNDGLRLNGRNDDGDWVRVLIPGSNQHGWVATELLNLQGSLQDLRIVTPEEPVLFPFKRIVLSTGTFAACNDTLPSGLVVQSANNERLATLKVSMQLNNVQGTAFITAGSNDRFSLYMLSGSYGWYNAASDDMLPVPVGAVVVDGTIAPFDPTLLASLPLQLLPVPVLLPDAITQNDIVSLTDAFYAARAETQATPTPQLTPDPSTCSRATRRETTLYAGPGDFYEAINNLRAGVTVDPVLAALDPDGRMWWQLRNSNWLLASDVREAGICPDVPVTQTITTPRRNTLSLETCETTNGPLRAGQQVHIEFTPPAFDNRGEARDAPMIDPGRISIGARTYRAEVTEMVQLGTVGIDDRYLRTFYITWMAVPGTHRIVGDRLSYEPICTLVVPVS